MRFDEPGLALVELGQAAEQLVTGRLDQRAHHGGGVDSVAHAQAGDRVGQPRAEGRVVVDRRLDDREAGRRALLPGVAEGGAHEVLDGEVDVGRLGDDHGVLAAGLGHQPNVGLPSTEERRSVVTAGEHHLVDIRMRDEVLAHGVVRRARQLHQARRQAGLLQVGDQRCRDSTRLRCGLQDGRRSGGHGMHQSTGGDGVGEVPGAGHEDDPMRRPHGTARLESLVLQGEVRRVRGEVDGLGDLRVAFAHRLARGAGQDRQGLTPCCLHAVSHQRKGSATLLPAGA